MAEDPGAAGRQVAVVDAAGRGGGAHRLGRDPVRRTRHRRRGFLPGEHDGVGERCGRRCSTRIASTDGSLTPRLLDALDAAERRGRRHPRSPVGGDSGGAGERRRAGRASSRCASRITRSRSPSCAGWSSCTAPTRSPGEADDCINEGRHDEAARLYERAAGAGARQPRAEVLGRAGRGAGRRTRTAASRTCAHAIALQPGWTRAARTDAAEVAPSAPGGAASDSQSQPEHELAGVDVSGLLEPQPTVEVSGPSSSGTQLVWSSRRPGKRAHVLDQQRHRVAAVAAAPGAGRRSSAAPASSSGVSVSADQRQQADRLVAGVDRPQPGVRLVRRLGDGVARCAAPRTSAAPARRSSSHTARTLSASISRSDTRGRSGTTRRRGAGRSRSAAGCRARTRSRRRREQLAPRESRAPQAVGEVGRRHLLERELELGAGGRRAR